jgi:hypothetical protein
MNLQHLIKTHETAIKVLREINAETLLLQYNVTTNNKLPEPSRYLNAVIKSKQSTIKALCNKYDVVTAAFDSSIDNPIFERYAKT